MSRVISVLLLAVCIFLGACRTRTYISTQKPEQKSPDGITRVTPVGHGAYGRAYIDQTKKLLDVEIVRKSGSNEVTLFSHRYKFVSADMSWTVCWATPSEVSVDIFDFGRGITIYDEPKIGVATNHIATLRFVKDGESDRFVEKH